MAKILIKSEKIAPFCCIFSIIEQFDSLLLQAIGTTVGSVAHRAYNSAI